MKYHKVEILIEKQVEEVSEECVAAQGLIQAAEAKGERAALWAREK